MTWKDPKHRKPVHIGPYITYNGGPRSTDSIRVIVIHDTEGGTAMGVATWGASGQKNASWHATVDDKEVVRCLPDNIIAWAAPGANRDGLQLEICGWARWTRRLWFIHQATLKRAAWHTARWCVDHKIPPRWLTDKQLKDGVSEGLVTHAQVSRVFHGSDHTDPGRGFPRGYFLYLVRRRVEWLQGERL